MLSLDLQTLAANHEAPKSGHAIELSKGKMHFQNVGRASLLTARHHCAVELLTGQLMADSEVCIFSQLKC